MTRANFLSAIVATICGIALLATTANAQWPYVLLSEPTSKVAALPSGGVYIVQKTSTTAPSSIRLVKLDTNGSTLWSVVNNYGVGTNDKPNAIVTDTLGDVYVVGRSDNDLYAVKFSGANGSVVWKKTYDAGAAQIEEGVCATLDSQGRLDVGGYVAFGEYAQPLVAQFNGNTGVVQWVKSFLGSAPTSIAADSSGDIGITGSFRLPNPPIADNGSGWDTFKLSGANGSTLWSWSFLNANGTKGNANGACITVDSNNNFVTTGGLMNAAGNRDLAVLKHAGNNGNVMWTTTYNGPQSNIDLGLYVLVDNFDNVAVTGYSVNNAYPDWVTGKINGVNGNPLWWQRYASPSTSPGLDIPAGIGCDPAGNVFVGGQSQALNPWAFAAIKYNSATGGAVLKTGLPCAFGDPTGFAFANGSVYLTGIQVPFSGPSGRSYTYKFTW